MKSIINIIKILIASWILQGTGCHVHRNPAHGTKEPEDTLTGQMFSENGRKPGEPIIGRIKEEVSHEL